MKRSPQASQSGASPLEGWILGPSEFSPEGLLFDPGRERPEYQATDATFGHQAVDSLGHLPIDPNEARRVYHASRWSTASRWRKSFHGMHLQEFVRNANDTHLHL